MSSATRARSRSLPGFHSYQMPLKLSELSSFLIALFLLFTNPISEAGAGAAEMFWFSDFPMSSGYARWSLTCRNLQKRNFKIKVKVAQYGLRGYDQGLRLQYQSLILLATVGRHSGKLTDCHSRLILGPPWLTVTLLVIYLGCVTISREPCNGWSKGKNLMTRIILFNFQDMQSVWRQCSLYWKPSTGN